MAAPPLAVDDVATTAEDTPVSIDVFANDINEDGHPLSLLEITEPEHGTVEIVGGSVLYTPYENYNGPDSFEYSIVDGSVGQGLFEERVQFFINYNFTFNSALSLGDVDSDGDLDIFVTNPNQVLFNDGNGTFSNSRQPLGNSDSISVELGDLDGDGDLDAFLANVGGTG